MSLDAIFPVTINTQNVAVGQKGYGVPMFAAYHTFWPEVVKTFGSLTELVDVGVPVTHPIYKWASAVKSPEPNPPQFKVGKRRETANAQTITITPKANPVAASVYQFIIGLNGVALATITYTADATPTIAEITGGLQTLFDAIAGVTATDNGTDLDIATDNAGDVLDLQVVTPDLVDVQDVSTDPGIATDLAAIEAVDSAWYFLSIDRQTEAEINAAATWVEANKKLFVTASGDSACKDAGSTTDVASDLRTNNYTRTALVFSDRPAAYPGAAICGLQGPKPPGGTNWAWQQVPGVLASQLTAGEISALEAKKCNYFTSLNSVTSFFWGSSAQGEWLDVTRGGDWLKSRLQERMQTLFLNAEKVGFTADGIDQVLSEVTAQMKDGIRAKVIDGKVPIIYTVPTIDEISSTDFANRTLPLLKAKARLQGAINKASFEVTLYQ